MAAEIIWEGVREFGAALKTTALAADVAGERIVREGGRIIAATTKTHMDGRPGPNRRSGDLIGSVAGGEAVRVGPGVWRSESGPGATGNGVPYERRIELGFHGADRLGRVYNQPPYPYLKPGLEEALPALGVLYRESWRAALRV